MVVPRGRFKVTHQKTVGGRETLDVRLQTESVDTDLEVYAEIAREQILDPSFLVHNLEARSHVALLRESGYKPTEWEY
jgi:hypothetical protein